MISFTKKKELAKKQKELVDKIKKRKQEEMEKRKLDIKKIKRYKELNIKFDIKQKYKSIIPLHFYTCWHTEHLPPLMKEHYEQLVLQNPELHFHLYNEDSCRQFIKDNFDIDILEAYNSLIPCSYKSDLWRFCVLFINGGIYFDIKFMCVNNFNLIALTEKEFFVKDRDGWGNGTLTGLISVKPGNEILLKCIRQIVENVRNKYYGKDALEPTGPNLLGKYFTNEDKQKMEMRFANINIPNLMDEWFILFNNTIILRQYNNYRKEQTKKHYSELWNERNVYI